MDNFVVSFKNNTNTVQEIDIFESSDLTGGGVTETVWNFRGNFADYSPVNPEVYNTTDELWWRQATLGQDGSIRLVVYQTDGSEIVIEKLTQPALADLTTTQLQTYLNATVDFDNVGDWDITGDSTTGEFNIQVRVRPAWITLNNISTTSQYNYGAKSLTIFGGVAPVWAPITVNPNLSQVSPALLSNPNVSVIPSNPNFDYNEFLWSTIQRTYDVKNFQLFSTSQAQLLQPFLFDRTLATGRIYQKVLTPTIDPYQQQNYIITPDEKGYILDGFTKIKYKVLPYSQIRIVLDYTFVDLATPLIAESVTPDIDQSFITPAFVENLEKGFDKFGCKFLDVRFNKLSEKLKEVAGEDGQMHPKWQMQIKSRLRYIKDLMVTYECLTEEEAEETPRFNVVGPELRRLNLWMPSPEFVQSQLDDEQGARKLFRNHDFPIEKT